MANDDDRRAARMWCATGLPGLTLLRAHYQGETFKPHFHDYFVIGTNESGESGTWIGGRYQRSDPGCLVFINPGVVHAGEAIGDRGWSYRALYPTQELLSQIAGQEVRPDGVLVGFDRSRARDEQLAAELVRAHRLAEEGDAETSERLRAVLVRLLRRYATFQPAPRRPRSPHCAVRGAVDYLETHLALNPSLEELSDRVGLSRFYLLRLFRRETGLTPHAYLNQARIDRAKRLLVAGRPIADVALEVGFADQSHLGRHFRRLVGITPRRFAEGVRSPWTSPRAAAREQAIPF